MGSHRPGHLVAVVAAASGPGLAHGGEMGMGVDKAGRHPLARQIQHGRVQRDLHISAHGLDDAVLHQNGGMIQNTDGNGDSFAVGQCDHIQHAPFQIGKYRLLQYIISRAARKGPVSPDFRA